MWSKDPECKNNKYFTSPQKWSSKCVIVTILFLITILIVKGDFVCPSKSVIFPCTCELRENSKEILSCKGPQVTQKHIVDLFAAVRLANKISVATSEIKKWFQISVFVIHNTNLMLLDLTPLLNLNFTRLDLSDNYELTSFSGPSNTNFKESVDSVEWENSKFMAKDVRLDFCNLGSADVGLFIEYLDPKSIKKLSIARNRIKGDDGLELIPHLNLLTHLQYLSLTGNLIRKISGGQFEHNNRLTKLDLSLNQISELGKDAFYQTKYLKESNELSLIDQLKSTKVPTYKPFVIDLSSNRLRDDGVHPLAFPFLHRTTFVSLNDNLFESLSLDSFGHILIDFDVFFSFSRNPLVCDDRLKWLRSRKKMLEKFFWGVDCSNDVGRDVFTTKIIGHKSKARRLPRRTKRSAQEEEAYEGTYSGIFEMVRAYLEPYVDDLWDLWEGHNLI